MNITILLKCLLNISLNSYPTQTLIMIATNEKTNKQTNKHILNTINFQKHLPSPNPLRLARLGYDLAHCYRYSSDTNF